MIDDDTQKRLFEFFNEIGIIHQLATSVFNQHLPDGLHMSHFIVLNHLTRLGDGRTPVRIAKAIQVTKATITHTLGVLEKRGFISIRPNPDDGRSKLVFLTQTGAQFRQKAIGSLLPAFETFSRELNLEDMQEAIPTLRQVRQVLDENRDV